MDNFSVSGKNRNIFVRILHFYVEGFRNMTVGKTLWIIILIKLFVMFVVLKMLFFPDFLSSKGNDAERNSNYVPNVFINRKKYLKNKFY